MTGLSIAVICVCFGLAAGHLLATLQEIRRRQPRALRAYRALDRFLELEREYIRGQRRQIVPKDLSSDRAHQLAAVMDYITIDYFDLVDAPTPSTATDPAPEVRAESGESM